MVNMYVCMYVIMCVEYKSEIRSIVSVAINAALCEEGNHFDRHFKYAKTIIMNYRKCLLCGSPITRSISGSIMRLFCWVQSAFKMFNEIGLFGYLSVRLPEWPHFCTLTTRCKLKTLLEICCKYFTTHTHQHDHLNIFMCMCKCACTNVELACATCVCTKYVPGLQHKSALAT